MEVKDKTFSLLSDAIACFDTTVKSQPPSSCYVN